jgi:hypothetical protein
MPAASDVIRRWPLVTLEQAVEVAALHHRGRALDGGRHGHAEVDDHLVGRFAFVVGPHVGRQEIDRDAAPAGDDHPPLAHRAQLPDVPGQR